MFSFASKPDRKILKIAFVIDIYPTISTFIINQITGLIDLGHEVYIFPAGKSNITEGDKEIKYGLKQHVFYPSSFVANRRKKYYTFFSTFFKSLYYTPKQTIYTLNPFIHGKKAFQLLIYFKYLYVLGKKIDVIQAHYGMFGIKALELKKTGWSAPIFTMFHGFDIRMALSVDRQMYTDLFIKGDYFQSISDFNYNHLMRLGAPKEKIVSHMVGIDIKNFIHKTRHKKKNETLIILSTGRLVWEKGYEYALEAMHGIALEGINFEYRIIGDGILKKDLMNLAEEFGIKDQVSFLGLKNQEEIKKELGNAHLFLMSSVAEVLPLALMEALASGLPAVASNVGSIKQILRHKESGLLIPPKDAIAIENALVWLHNNVDQWKSFGDKGHEQIAKNFDVQKLNVKLQNCYYNTLHRLN